MASIKKAFRVTRSSKAKSSGKAVPPSSLEPTSPEKENIDAVVNKTTPRKPVAKAAASTTPRKAKKPTPSKTTAKSKSKAVTPKRVPTKHKKTTAKEKSAAETVAPTAKPRKCGICKVVGHNRGNCPQKDRSEEKTAKSKTKPKSPKVAKSSGKGAKGKAKSTKAKADSDSPLKQTTLPFTKTKKPADSSAAKASLDAKSVLTVLEQMLQFDEKQLGVLHKKVAERVPLTKIKDFEGVIAELNKTKAIASVHERVYTQLTHSEAATANIEKFLRRKTICTSKVCSANKRGKSVSMLSSICTICGSTDGDILQNNHLNEKQVASMRKKCDNSAVRAIKYIKRALKEDPTNFEYFAGDIVFLVRNAIFRAPGPVGTAADQLVRGMIKKYDKSELGTLDAYAELEHTLGFVECQHAKLEMKLLEGDDLADTRSRIANAIKSQALEDVVRYDPSDWEDGIPKTECSYCLPCGKFAETLSQSECDECGKDLQRTADYQMLCEALVWTSVFSEVGVPVSTANGTLRTEQILSLIKSMRPYPSPKEAGADSFVFLCYFMTHLFFVLTNWGAVKLTDRALFSEEYVFCLTALYSVIEMDDPELAGELTHTLCILGCDDEHPAVMAGRKYLLKKEKRGLFVNEEDSFYKRYHAAYCGVIGLADFKADPARTMDVKWRKYFA